MKKLKIEDRKTKVKVFGILFLFCVIFHIFTMPVNAKVNAEEMADLRITEIMVYSEGVIQVTKEGSVCCGNEFYTSVEGNILPRSIRVISGPSDSDIEYGIEYISLSVRDETQPETLIKRSLTMQDLINQSMNKRVDVITHNYGQVSGLLYRLEGDLMFLSDVTWVNGNKIINTSFFTMKVSDIKNLMSTDTPVFEPAYMATVPETSTTVPGTSTISPAYPGSYYSGYYSSSYSSYYNTMQVPGRDKQLSWKDDGNGSRNVSILYRSDGVSWEPVYNLDIVEGDTSARFGLWARVSNDMGVSLEGVEMSLVAGNIRLLENRYGMGMEYMNAAQSALGNMMAIPDAVIGASISALEEYEVYYLGKTSLDFGETKLVKVFDKEVAIKRDFVWDARSANTWDTIIEDGKVHNIYRLINDENTTWPYGTVSVYRDLMFVGEDTMSWTPNGREAKVTVGYAPDIEVKKRVTVKEDPENRWRSHHTATLKMTNYKNEQITLTVIESFNRDAENFKSNMIYTEKPGNLLFWNVTLGPGEKKDLTYEFKVD